MSGCGCCAESQRASSHSQPAAARSCRDQVLWTGPRFFLTRVSMAKCGGTGGKREVVCSAENSVGLVLRADPTPSATESRPLVKGWGVGLNANYWKPYCIQLAMVQLPNGMVGCRPSRELRRETRVSRDCPREARVSRDCPRKASVAVQGQQAMSGPRQAITTTPTYVSDLLQPD